MKNSSLISIHLGISIILVASGCAKPKPRPTEPLVRGEVNPVPSGETPGSSDRDLKKQRIMQEAKEIFQTLYFSLDQAELDPKSRTILTEIHRFMRDNPEASFTVTGHGDERGTNEYNLALGEKRARAVTSYLANLGVLETRMQSTSFGEEKPAEEGRTEAAWKQNRRAEFTVDTQVDTPRE